MTKYTATVWDLSIGIPINYLRPVKKSLRHKFIDNHIVHQNQLSCFTIHITVTYKMETIIFKNWSFVVDSMELNNISNKCMTFILSESFLY